MSFSSLISFDSRVLFFCREPTEFDFDLTHALHLSMLWCGDSRLRNVSPFVANTVALISFVILMISELAPKFLREMVAIVLLAAFVMYIKVLGSWNSSLWFITLEIIRDLIVPRQRRGKFGRMCTAFDSCFGLPSNSRGQ